MLWRAERGACRQFRAPRRQPRQQEVRDVRQRDQQDQRNGDLQYEQFACVAAGQLFAQRARAEMHVDVLDPARVRTAVARRTALDVALHDRCRLCFDLRRRGTGREPAHDRREIFAAGVVDQLFRPKRERHEQSGLDAWKHEARRQYADHAVLLTVQPQAVLEDARIGVEAVAPERIGQHGHMFVARDSFVIREGATQDRRYAQGREHRRRYPQSGEPLRRRSTFDKIEAGVGVQRAVGQRRHVAMQIHIVGNRNVVGATAAPSGVQIDQSAGVTVRQLAEVHAVDQREHQCVRADAKRASAPPRA